METLFATKDAEAAVYAIEAAVNLCNSLACGDYATAILDAVALFGFGKNAIGA